MHVPFLDLKVQYRQIQDEILPMITNAMSSAAFVGGPEVSGFENEFAKFCEAGYCAGVGSGTDALRFALIAAGVGPGHEVITVPNTFIATTEAISQTGAIPAFVDIDPETYNMAPDKLENYLEKRFSIGRSPSTPLPKAVIPVHLYGQPADMDPILNLARKYDLYVIEDACQAHGAIYRDRKVGTFGVAGCFSFYPGKNLGAYGEGGAVVSDNEEIINKIKKIRDHGQAKKYLHDMEGYNGRLDAIQAGILRIKLKRLKDWNESRRKNAACYTELLSEISEVTLPHEISLATSVYHLYVIQIENRNGLQKFLGEKGIGTGLHYPIPLHMQKAYKHLGYKEGDFPVAEKTAKNILSLPMFPELSRGQIEYVADCIKQWLNR